MLQSPADKVEWALRSKSWHREELNKHVGGDKGILRGGLESHRDAK